MASEERLGRIEFLDFAKGFAILGVVLYHYLSSSTSGVLQRATQLGGAGVHLFLMLAGFGLALASAPVSWGAFYRRRFVRILVPYYLVVTVLFVVNLFRPYFPGDGLYAYAGHIFLFKMFDARIFMSFGSVFWFVSVLVALYLVFPLLVWLEDRLGGVRFVALGALISLVYLAGVAVSGVSQIEVFSSFFLTYLWEFCLGMALGRAYRDDRLEFWNQPLWVLAIIALFGLASMAALALVGGSVGRLVNDIPALIGFTALVVDGDAAAVSRRGGASVAFVPINFAI